MIYGTAKAINPQLQVGFHVWHVNSFSPFYRAEQDYSRLRETRDFLKIVIYNNCAGPRLAEVHRERAVHDFWRLIAGRSVADALRHARVQG